MNNKPVQVNEVKKNECVVFTVWIEYTDYNTPIMSIMSVFCQNKSKHTHSLFLNVLRSLKTLND